jgi:hypothetical protein
MVLAWHLLSRQEGVEAADFLPSIIKYLRPLEPTRRQLEWHIAAFSAWEQEEEAADLQRMVQEHIRGEMEVGPGSMLSAYLPLPLSAHLYRSPLEQLAQQEVQVATGALVELPQSEHSYLRLVEVGE